MSRKKRSNSEAAYITIVEGPPPEFSTVNKPWTASLAEGPEWVMVATCQMRTLDGQGLVDRCSNAWQQGRPAFLDYPRPAIDGIAAFERTEAEIVAARWQKVDEGQMLTLWVRTDAVEDLGLFED